MMHKHVLFGVAKVSVSVFFLIHRNRIQVPGDLQQFTHSAQPKKLKPLGTFQLQEELKIYK